MTQTKSPAHTAACRKILDPSACSCHVGAYLDQHPFICTNHSLAWHHRDRITCEEFEQGLDEAAGFSAELDDDATLESRKFKISRDAKVLAQSVEMKSLRAQIKYWKQGAMVAAGCGALGMAAAIGTGIAGGF